MTITLTIELSDELEQQVMVQAKQQQVSPESIVVQSLNQSFCFLECGAVRCGALRTHPTNLQEYFNLDKVQENDKYSIL